MDGSSLNLSSSRARKSRLSIRMKKFGYSTWVSIGVISGLAAAYLVLITDQKLGWLLFAIALLSLMWVVWYKTELEKLPANQPGNTVDDLLDADFLAKLRSPVTPKSAWQALTGHWQEIFITNRLLIDPQLVENNLSDQETDMTEVWRLARKIQSAHEPNALHAGTVATALILSSPTLSQFLTSQKLKADDVLEVHDWLARLISYQQSPKPYFGGIGRDWAFGFTPNLERFSVNISQQVQNGGGHAHFMSRSATIDAVISNLSQATGSVALVGNTGIGKTSIVYALAERLLQDKTVGQIVDHQIVALNASLILSSSKHDLEHIMLTLFGEAIQSGNMILFLDDAQLFFQEGIGSFDLSQILLPVLQNRRLRLICAFGVSDYQRLKSSNPALAAALSPVMIQEPPQAEAIKIAEDSALGIEYSTKTIITYDAIREAYRVSGQYIQDMAYPGKIIRLLEQAASYPTQNTITADSVHKAVETTLGVKVGGAQGQEADTLLHLEEKIHERMVNQVRAVNVVASALRRARAGVGNTKRPIGSFLFLGPTGVGKTELAKSLAATYFGSESSMIRLDMSEYQQASDVSRLLSDGSTTESLLLAIRKQPFSVVLLDEIEKAHSSVLNLLLQMLDEGQLTDQNGQQTSFRNAIIIVTSNAGANDIIERIQHNQPLEEFERPLIDKLIASGTFRAELVNRFDEVVLFRPLNQDELRQVATLMLGEVNKNLANQNISVSLTPAALDSLVEQGYDPQFGSRPMRRVIQRTVEDVVAQKILKGEVSPGTTITLDEPDIATKKVQES